ncbi:MAG: FHA domain-containing protein [Clostridiales bacterium]|jgi:pSer/pThr/pTyr-binding forkhead associated (FHA) protein|nr:FHA domain-containing protein [Clostridiales bacterium]
MTVFGGNTPVVLIVAGVLSIALIAGIAAILIVRGKKNKQSSSYESSKEAAHANGIYDGKAEYVGAANGAGTLFTIKLSNPNRPDRSWTLPVNGALVIGRAEHAAIRLDDKSVSREQCKIVNLGAGLAVVHVSRTNKTRLNGVAVAASSPIQSGDTLKFGREVLRIDFIQPTGAPLPPQPE